MSEVDQTVHLIAVGDFLIHDACIESAFNDQSKSYDFSQMLSYVAPIIKKGDISICNLETTISGDDKKFSGYPRFNAPENLLSAIHDSGFTIVSTANNHSVDFGEQGILNTIAAISRNGLLFTGTSDSSDPCRRNRILDVKGIKIGINSYTYGTNENKIPDSSPWLINMIDFDLIESDIKFMRQKNVEVIIICLHAGEEYLLMPDSQQKNYVNKLQDLGVNIILGNHPHIIQPAILSDKLNNFTIYSLGNFLSNQKDLYRDIGIIVDIEISRMNKAFQILNVNYIPTFCHRWENNGKFEFRVIPLTEYESIGKQLPEFPFDYAKSMLEYAFNQINAQVQK